MLKKDTTEKVIPTDWKEKTFRRFREYFPLQMHTTQWRLTAELPGPVSGLSHNYRDIFATTPATNAFYNVTKGQYNVATDQNGNVKPMIPKTKDGLIKVIDNRRNGGKFLCITTKGAHTIDE